MLVVAPLFILGWLLIAFAEYVEMIFAGRFITVFSMCNENMIISRRIV